MGLELNIEAHLLIYLAFFNVCLLILRTALYLLNNLLLILVVYHVCHNALIFTTLFRDIMCRMHLKGLSKYL